MLTLVSISNAADDLPPRRSRGGASLWGQALLTSVSNSIAGSVLPPSVCEGTFPYARGRYLMRGGASPLSDLLFPLSGVTSLIP